MGERMKRVRAEMAANQQAQRPAAPKKTENIFAAVKAGDAEAVKEALGQGRSAAVHATDQYRKTPIEYAARENRPEIVQLLLQAGADVNYKDMTDRTVLGMAVDSGHSETVRVLLAAGADPRVPYGGKARRITVKDWTLMHAAAWGPHPQVAALLSAAGVDHDLHSAAGLGELAVLADLLDGATQPPPAPSHPPATLKGHSRVGDRRGGRERPAHRRAHAASLGGDERADRGGAAAPAARRGDRRKGRRRPQLPVPGRVERAQGGREPADRRGRGVHDARCGGRGEHGHLTCRRLSQLSLVGCARSSHRWRCVPFLL